MKPGKEINIKVLQSVSCALTEAYQYYKVISASAAVLG